MSRIVYVNGEYLPEEEAKISIFDRGFLFADGVYEVTSVLGGKLIEFAGHAARLKRSLGELEMAAPVDDDTLLEIHRELVARNGIEDASENSGQRYIAAVKGACAGGGYELALATDHHPEPYLWRLLIDRLHQRRGIASMAMDLVEEECRRMGATRPVTSCRRTADKRGTG